MARVIGQMKKLWRQVRYFEITESNTYNPIASRLRIFNLRSFPDRGDCRLYFYRGYFMPFRGIYR